MRFWIGLCLVLTSCGVFGGDPSKPGLPLPLPALDLSLLPAVPNTPLKLLAEVAAARLDVDPTAKDALTALAACTDQVTYCYTPGSKELGTCLSSTPSCTTDTPWTEDTACCPDACKQAFDAAVAGGEAPTKAFERLFFLEPDCFPGVRALLEAP